MARPNAGDDSNPRSGEGGPRHTPAALAADPAFTGTYAIRGRRATAVYDEFSRYTDGALSGSSLVGGAWSRSGAQSPTITSGKVSSSGTGYFGQVLASPITSMACEVVWSGTGTNNAMTLIASSDATITISNAVHCNFGPGGFTMTPPWWCASRTCTSAQVSTPSSPVMPLRGCGSTAASA